MLIFNPPYVPTPADEVGGTGIEAAWAGGRNGRVVIDRFLPLVKVQYIMNSLGEIFIVTYAFVATTIFAWSMLHGSCRRK